MFSVEDSGKRNELKSVVVEYETEDEDAGVPDVGLPIPSVNKPGWRRTTHTCNDVYQVENNIKFIAAEALRGVGSLIFDARGSTLASELEDSVTER